MSKSVKSSRHGASAAMTMTATLQERYLTYRSEVQTVGRIVDV
jgi:Tfp pilus assembly protein PilE